MFLGTVGISERQVKDKWGHHWRKLVVKRMRDVVVDRKVLKMRDQTIKKQVEAHINRFPRTESHYCRKKARENSWHQSWQFKRCMISTWRPMMTSLFHCHFTAVYFEKWGSSSIPQRKTNVACAALTETGTKMKRRYSRSALTVTSRRKHWWEKRRKRWRHVR